MKLNIINIWQRDVVRDSFTTTIWNVLGKGVGFLVPLFIAALFGVDLRTDVFFFVYGIIIYLTSIFSASLESSVVPFIAKIKSNQKGEISLFVNRLLSLALLSMTGLAIILIIFARPIFNVITNFPGDSHSLLFRLFLEICPLLILVVLSSILAGLLNAHFKFWLPAISPGIRAVICIATIFISKDTLGIHSIPLGYILGEITRLLIFIYVLTKKRLVSLRLNFHFDSELIGFFKVISFQMISMTVIGLDPLVDKAMASWLGIGSISILQYADRLYFIPITFITSGLIVVVLSRWSDNYYKHKEITVLKKDVHKTIIVVAVLAAILTLVLSLFSRQIVSIAYGRGQFPLQELDTVRVTFLCYLAGLTFYLVRQVVVRAHIVLKNTLALMKVSLVSNILNILFNLILMRRYGVKGIALSTTFATGLGLIYLYYLFHQKALSERAQNER